MTPTANPGACEEGAAFGAYIPCNKPAVAIVGWLRRSDRPIRMCAACEWDNFKDHGAYRVQMYKEGDQ